MEKIIDPIINIAGSILFSLFFITAVSSTALGQDFGSGETGKNFIVSANILFVAANIDSDRMSISYDGISNSPTLFQSSKSLYSIDSAVQSGNDFERTFEDNGSYKFGRKFKELRDCFFKYIHVDGMSSEDTGTTGYLPKSKLNTGRINPDDFKFNMSLNIGSDAETVLKMDAIKLESSWHQTHFDVIYHYEKNEIELALNSSYINKYILDGMKLEFQANPSAGSGSILLKMSL